MSSPKTSNTRPATDAARLAVFSSLGGAAQGARAADLFAGTGAYGLEAASRGAASVFFVERAAAVFKILRENIGRVQKAAPAELKAALADCLSPAIYGENKFDLIFADPPYAMLSEAGFAEKLFSIFAHIAADGAIAVLEAPAEYAPPAFPALEPLNRLGKKSNGKPSQIIFRVKKT